MECFRMYADEEGESHFEAMEIELSLRDFAPPAQPMGVSQPKPVTKLIFLNMPAGWFGDWHPAPARQYCFILSGEVEGTVSDGTAKRFRAGDVLLMEDTTGKGHLAKPIGNEGANLAMVQLG